MRKIKKEFTESVTEAPSRLAQVTDERVVRLEEQYESLSGSVQEVKGEVQALSHRFDQFASDIHTTLNRVGRPQWGVIVSMVALIFSVMLSSGGAGFTILKMSADHGNELRLLASTYQDKVVDSRFREVETQFKGVTNELDTQVKNNSLINEDQTRNLEQLRHQLSDVDERMIDRNTQWREDFDKYFMPQLQALTKQNKSTP